MKTIFIIFILFFLAACSSHQEVETPGLHKKRVARRASTKNNIIEKRAKAISYSFKINPFLTKEEEARINDSYERPLGLNLSAIFYSSSNSKVIIDGCILKEGDMIDNKVIKEIRPQEAILKDSKSEYILKMKGTEK